ncbi:hypothetical protein [Streptomyces sp. NBC_01190]|nr:hypothetical protein OG519_00250 [Streptomyces sp. NBC_01190]
MPATDDPQDARAWYETLRQQGVEGLIAKTAAGPYRAARIWT